MDGDEASYYALVPLVSLLTTVTTYYRVQVRWDEDDARELSLEWLRGKCGYVPQEPLLFDIG